MSAMEETFDAVDVKEPKLGLKVKTNSFSPAVALRLGYIPNASSTWMGYLDFGGVFRSAKVKAFDRVTVDGIVKENDDNYSCVKVSKVTPVLRVGVQKNVWNSMTLDFNIECSFDTKKSRDGITFKKGVEWGVHLSAVSYIR